MLLEIKKYFHRIISEPKAIFFKNVGLKQTIIKNTFWLAVAEGLSKVFKLILFIYVARVLGANEYGKFNFALSFVSLFLVTSELGLFSIITREFSRDQKKEKDFPALLSLKLILNLFTFLIILIGSRLISNDTLIRNIILILGVEVLLTSLLGLFYAFFRAREKMEYQSGAQIGQAFLTTVFGLVVLFFFPSALGLGWSYLLSTTVVLIIILFFFNWKLLNLRIHLSKKIWLDYFKMSYPLALAGGLGSLTANFDATFMGIFKQITQNGWYGAVQKISGIIMVPITFITMSFVPVLSRFAVTSIQQWQKAWNYHLRIMIFLGLPLAVGGYLVASQLIDWVFDPSFLPALFCLQMLLIGSAVLLLSSPFKQALLAANQQKKIFWLTLGSAILNIVLNLILIPKISLDGAAVAFLVTSLFGLVAAGYYLIRLTDLKPFNSIILGTLFKSALACLVMALSLAYIAKPSWHVLVNIGIGIVFYLLGFGLFSIMWRYAKVGLLKK